MARTVDFEIELPDLERAYKQGIKAEQLEPGVYAVTSSNGVDMYKVSHDMCNCTGYWRWHKCKHIALVHVMQKENGEIQYCEQCGKYHIVVPAMTADEWEKLHDD